jgi:hypothetical protein
MHPARIPLAAVVLGLIIAVPAEAATNCGSVRRPFTDARPSVTVTKGSIKCSTARGVMSKYWGTTVTAFRSTVALRYRGIHWVCKPTVRGEVPSRWACRGGGPNRNRFRVRAED